jgi:hypothetical protein
VLPVKETASTSSLSVSVVPTLLPDPTTTLTMPSGAPASSSALASSRAGPGACVAGLSTTAFPVASAGAIFQAGMAMG